jgi:hypothetical protein
MTSGRLAVCIFAGFVFTTLALTRQATSQSNLGTVGAGPHALFMRYYE